MLVVLLLMLVLLLLMLALSSNYVLSSNLLYCLCSMCFAR